MQVLTIVYFLDLHITKATLDVTGKNVHPVVFSEQVFLTVCI